MHIPYGSPSPTNMYDIPHSGMQGFTVTSPPPESHRGPVVLDPHDDQGPVILNPHHTAGLQRNAQSQ
eukprot:gene6190-16145_t